MAKTLLRSPTGKLLFEDPGDLAYGEEESPLACPSEVICGTSCDNTYTAVVSGVGGTDVCFAGVPVTCPAVNNAGATLTRTDTDDCKWGLQNTPVYNYLVECEGDGIWRFTIYMCGSPKTVEFTKAGGTCPVGTYERAGGTSACTGGSLTIS